MKKPVKIKELQINCRIIPAGLNILVNGRSFPIVYPKAIWRGYPKPLKNILQDNIAYSSTIFLPQMLQLKQIVYQTGRPLAETYLFQNGIKDMPCCALSDKKSSLKYVKDFFNTQYLFEADQIKTPSLINFRRLKNRRPTAIIPFSFGKESLLTFSLCQELGIRPILVNFIEPSNDYEYLHKKKLIKEFEREMKVKVYTVDYKPGLLRYGKYWGLKTELGWGLQTTEYALLCLPFAHYFKADYLLLGNEQSCNDWFYDKEGILTYKAGYDQHHYWTGQQGLLASLILGRKLEVASFMDPLYEIAITKILHHRYPKSGRYQMSCMADNIKAKKNRWCQHCVKCGYIYALMSAFDLDLQSVGFTQNLFDEKHQEIYRHFFNYDPKNPAYGSQEELGLAFYLAYLRGQRGTSIAKFKKQLFNKMQKQKKHLSKIYLGLNTSDVVPVKFRKNLLAIYKAELKPFNQK